jgi:hypothetical protein
MQHFKANLLADMMVVKLLDIQQQGPDVQLGNSVSLKVKQQAQSQHYDQQQWPVGSNSSSSMRHRV